MVRGLRFVATVGASLLVGSAVTAYVVSRDSAPEMPRLVTQTLAADAATDLPFTWTATPADGCDGYTMSAPVAQRAGGDARSQSVLLQEQPHTVGMNAVCLASTDELGSPEEHVARMASAPRALVSRKVESPFGMAWRTESTMGGLSLTEWWTEHGGRLWVVGVLHEPDDLSQVATAEQMLVSWSWT